MKSKIGGTLVNGGVAVNCQNLPLQVRFDSCPERFYWR